MQTPTTLAELKAIACLVYEFFLEKNGDKRYIAEIYRIYHREKPDEIFAYEYATRQIKRLFNY